MILLDSSFLIAFHNTRDVHHHAAAGVMDEILRDVWGTPLLAEYVFLEVTTVLAARRGIETAACVGELLLSAREVEFVPCSGIFLESFDLFRVQETFGLSFVDAALLVLARRTGAEHIATFDDGFRNQSGVSVVPVG